MTPRVRARSMPAAALRCAGCHDDLSERVWTCPRCGAALHRTCALHLGCTTIGCVTRPRRAPSVAAPTREELAAREHFVLHAATFWVPALLMFLWPAWAIGGFVLRDALGLDGPTFMGPSLDYWAPILAFALGLGSAVGHLVLAPAAGLRGLAGQHGRVGLGVAAGFASSFVAMFLLAAFSG